MDTRIDIFVLGQCRCERLPSLSALHSPRHIVRTLGVLPPPNLIQLPWVKHPGRHKCSAHNAYHRGRGGDAFPGQNPVTEHWLGYLVWRTSFWAGNRRWSCASAVFPASIVQGRRRCLTCRATAVSLSSPQVPAVPQR